MFTLDDLLEIAIKMEENGEAVYLNSIKKISNKDIRSMLEWMANEEACHARWFADQKDKLSLEVDEKDLKEMVPDVLKDMIGEKTLSLNEVDFSEIKSLPELLSTFIGFEKETIMFYEVLEMFIDDTTVLDGLKAIIKEEKHHIEKLTVMMNTFQDDA